MDMPPPADKAAKPKASGRGFLFREMKNDLVRRRPHYISDWTDTLYAKTLSASFFMFFTSIAPAITFAAVLDKNTREDGVAQGQFHPRADAVLTGSPLPSAVYKAVPLLLRGTPN